MYICMMCKKPTDIKDVNSITSCKFCSGRIFVKERNKQVRTHKAI